jgi:hypothetical protein
MDLSEVTTVTPAKQWFVGWNSWTMHLPNDQMLAQCKLPFALPLDGAGMTEQEVHAHPQLSTCRTCQDAA